MSEVVVLPWLVVRGGSGGDGVAVKEYLDGAHVAREVPGVAVGPCQCVWGDFGVVLGGLWRAVTEPGLQLEQRHWFLGVVELACDRGSGSVAGDVASDVGGWDAGLAAKHRNDGVVDVVGGEPAGSDGEQQVDPLAGAPVQQSRLGWPGGLPGVEGLAEDRIHRLGERGAGLVRGDVEQADCVARQDLVGVAGDRGSLVLPADAADPQAGDLVAA
jgi:hypothetical protein